MKILQCACILGAIAALYPLAQRVPVRLGEASLAGGEALLAGGTVSEDETAMQQAIDVARRQNAKTFELRSAMSLARLWRDQGKRQQAGDVLAPIYGWFTEGFDMCDLEEAKELLDTLT